jgi:hypothetical protein
MIGVRLFGSRIVEKEKLAQARSQRFQFLDAIQGLIGEQRIDLVIVPPEQLDTDEFLRSLDTIEL